MSEGWSCPWWLNEREAWMFRVSWEASALGPACYVELVSIEEGASVARTGAEEPAAGRPDGAVPGPGHSRSGGLQPRGLRRAQMSLERMRQCLSICINTLGSSVLCLFPSTPALASSDTTWVRWRDSTRGSRTTLSLLSLGLWGRSGPGWGVQVMFWSGSDVKGLV